VQLDDALAPRLAVQPVTFCVTRVKSTLVAVALPLEVRERSVAGIGLRLRHYSPPPRVPDPDQLRIRLESFRGRELLRPEFLPQACEGIAKRGNPGLRRDARAREHGHRRRVVEQVPRAGDIVMHLNMYPVRVPGS